MSESAKRTYKAFPLVWDEIAKNDHETDKMRPLTELQSAILLGAIEHCRWPTRWIGLGISAEQLEKEIAEIKDRLMREAGGEMATKADIRDGIYEAANRIALQIASGSFSGLNFSTDENGIVTIPPSGGVSDEDLPVDDPTSAIDETEAARGGGAISVRIGINTIWSNLATWFGVDAAPDTPLATSQTRLKQIYQLDPTGADALVAQYYSDRQQALPSVTSFANTLDGYLYCKGISTQTIAEWIYEVHTANQQAQASFILAALTQEQLTAWYNIGTTKPSTTYKEYGCVPSPTEIMFYLALGVGQYSQTSWKPNHRLLITMENYFTDADSDTLDAAWYNDGVGVPQNRIANWFLSQGGVNFTKPTANQIPYSASHKYQFTIETPNNTDKLFISLTGTSGMNVPYTPSVPDEGIKITIQDLGEIAL